MPPYSAGLQPNLLLPRACNETFFRAKTQLLPQERPFRGQSWDGVEKVFGERQGLFQALKYIMGSKLYSF